MFRIIATACAGELFHFGYSPDRSPITDSLVMELLWGLLLFRVALFAKDISKYMIETGAPSLEFMMPAGTWGWGGDISKVDEERAPPGLDVTAF